MPASELKGQNNFEKLSEMVPNIPIILASAFIPFCLGYIWFHPKTFGGETWAKIAKLTPEDSGPAKPLLLFSSLILNAFAAFGLYLLTVHASGVFSLMGGEVELMKTGTASDFLAEHGQNFLTFKHGLFHGIPAAFFFALPAYGYVTIFEKKSAKYLLVNMGYWIIALSLMGGVISQWGWQLV